MARLVFLAIVFILSPFILIEASLVDGDKKILDLRVLNQIMDGINQLNNNLRQAVEFLKEIASGHRSNAPLPKNVHGLPTKRKRPSVIADSFMDEIGNSGVRRAMNPDIIENNDQLEDDEGNENSNTNINTNTNYNSNRNDLRHFLSHHLPYRVI